MHRAQVQARRYACLKPLERKVSEYLRENVFFTTSGMAWEPAIPVHRSVVGQTMSCTQMDYPYQYVPEEVAAMEALPLSGRRKRRSSS